MCMNPLLFNASLFGFFQEISLPEDMHVALM